MLTYSSFEAGLIRSGFKVIAGNITEGDRSIAGISMHSPGYTASLSARLVIMYVSDFTSSAVELDDAFCVLIPDTMAHADTHIDGNNWLMLSCSTQITEVLVFANDLLNRSHRLDTLSLRLSRSLLTSDSIEDLLAIGESEIGEPIFLSDNSTKVLFWSNIERIRAIDDELIQVVTKHGFVTDEFYEKYDYNNYLLALRNSDRAFISRSPLPEKRDRIIAKLVVNGVYFGWIVIVSTHKAFTEFDCELADVLAETITMALEKQRTLFPFGFQENLLMELFSGQVTNAEEFWVRAKCFNWYRSDNYRLIIMDYAEKRALESEDRAALGMKKHLAMLFPEINIISIRNKLCMLLETENPEYILNQLQAFKGYYNLTVGVSECFHNILDFHRVFSEVTDLLQLGPVISPNRPFYLFEDLAIYHLLYRMGNLYRSKKELYSPSLSKLIVYDAQHQTDYLDTLRTYLKHQSVLASANDMHIHRNTMNYRLQRIEEIIGPFLDNSEEIHRLWLSMKLHDLAENTASDP